ncbi:Apelin receptor early endogenous ligand [Takifugu flavidus]|uniref:Apelin receptor early endogenous ligand n=1 Tax=Takifugu flavidus TaxID=433684 RepID=A0A5C6MV17_9TELE|nr:Apelin receptor early endogenous ligand [Takifugu flavidus]
MRIFNLLFLILLVIAVLAPASAAKPGKHEHICAFPGKPQVSAKKDFLKLRRKYHRLHCHHRRCVALHSRVPFP